MKIKINKKDTKNYIYHWTHQDPSCSTVMKQDNAMEIVMIIYIVTGVSYRMTTETKWSQIDFLSKINKLSVSFNKKIKLISKTKVIQKDKKQSLWLNCLISEKMSMKKII